MKDVCEDLRKRIKGNIKVNVRVKNKTFSNMFWLQDQNQMAIEFQKPIIQLSFLCRPLGIKIAWINPCPDSPEPW